MVNTIVTANQLHSNKDIGTFFCSCIYRCIQSVHFIVSPTMTAVSGMAQESCILWRCGSMFALAVHLTLILSSLRVV